MQGLPYALAITPANVTGRNGALLAFEQNKDELTEKKAFYVMEGIAEILLPME